MVVSKIVPAQLKTVAPIWLWVNAMSVGRACVCEPDSSRGIGGLRWSIEIGIMLIA